MRAFEVTTLYSGKGMNDVLKKYIVVTSSCSKAVVEFRKVNNQEKVMEVTELKHGVIIDGNYHS